MQIDIRRVYVFLAVTCYLHVWQNDWDRYCGNRGEGVGGREGGGEGSEGGSDTEVRISTES